MPTKNELAETIRAYESRDELDPGPLTLVISINRLNGRFNFIDNIANKEQAAMVLQSLAIVSDHIKQKADKLLAAQNGGVNGR